MLATSAVFADEPTPRYPFPPGPVSISNRFIEDEKEIGLRLATKNTRSHQTLESVYSTNVGVEFRLRWRVDSGVEGNSTEYVLHTGSAKFSTAGASTGVRNWVKIDDPTDNTRNYYVQIRNNTNRNANVSLTWRLDN